MPRGCVPNPRGPGGNAFDGSRSVLQPSPPRLSGTRPASSAALPASLPCLVTVPPAARLPTLPEAHSFGFTRVYRTARPGERLIRARLRLARPCVPCGSGPRVAGTGGPAGRTLRLGLGLASPVAPSPVLTARTARPPSILCSRLDVRLSLGAPRPHTQESKGSPKSWC